MKFSTLVEKGFSFWLFLFVLAIWVCATPLFLFDWVKGLVRKPVKRAPPVDPRKTIPAGTDLKLGAPPAVAFCRDQAKLYSGGPWGGAGLNNVRRVIMEKHGELPHVHGLHMNPLDWPQLWDIPEEKT